MDNKSKRINTRFNIESAMINFIMTYLDKYENDTLIIVDENVKNEILDLLNETEFHHSIKINDESDDYSTYSICKISLRNKAVKIIIEPSHYFDEKTESLVLRNYEDYKYCLIQKHLLEEYEIKDSLYNIENTIEMECDFEDYSDSYCNQDCTNCECNNEDEYKYSEDFQSIFNEALHKEFFIEDEDTEEDKENQKEKEITKAKEINDKIKDERKYLEALLDNLIDYKTLEEQLYFIQSIINEAFKNGYRQALINEIGDISDILDKLEEDEENKK